MKKKWLSALLAALMILSLPVTALADAEQAPDPDPAQTEAAGEEAAPAAEDLPETMALDAPAPVAEGVTVSLTGAVDAIQRVIYQGTEELVYFTDSTGTFYNRLDSAGNNEAVYVTQTDSIQTTLSPIANGEERAQMGFDMRIFLDNETDVSVQNATVKSDKMDIGSRCVDILLPDSGSVTIDITSYGGDVPATIPYTFYNEDWDNGVIVGGGSVATGAAAGEYYAFPEDGTVTTGGCYEVWTGPGYEIQVIEGGHIVEVRAPDGAAAANVPAGSTCYVLGVDMGAERFVIAAVAQGESFTAPADETGAESAETAADEPEITATGTFKDVADSAWYKDTVERAYAAGIVTGTGADTFSPNACASRGQTVTMIWREAGSPQPGQSAAFQDLTADYYKDAVSWASFVGAVNGSSDTTFDPDSVITREQLAAMLYRMAGQPTPWSGGLVGNWSDGGDVQPYAQMAMQWALDYGIITGYGDGTLRPGAAATRAEVCAMLLRYDELVGCYPTSMPAASEEQQPEDSVVTYEAPASHTERNLDNPNLIKPKRDKIDDGLYDNGEDGGQWIQQWSETFWDLDRSGEDIMWCTRNLTRIYAGPGVEYDVVCTLYATYEVSRLAPDENGWTKVVYHEYLTGEGFTGWDYTGYVRTDYLSKVVPCHPHVADFSSGPALEKWCHTGIPEGDLYADYGASANGTFYHEAYDPAIDGDTYTYTLRGGGHIIIHNVDPAGIISVEASGEVETHSLLLFISLENGYGIKCSEGYGGGYGLSPSGDGLSCELYWETDVSNDEDIEMTMIHGDGAPRVLQVTIKDPLGGCRGGDGTSRFIFLDSSGSLASYHMAENFFNLKPGYKLKSLSPYASVGKVDNNELHFFTVKDLPTGTDEIFFEVVRG